MRLAAGSRFAVAVQIIKMADTAEAYFLSNPPVTQRQQPIYPYRTIAVTIANVQTKGAI